MSVPPDDMLNVAILWLRGNEGEGAELAACQHVADWLEQKQEDRQLLKIAHAMNVRVGHLREQMKVADKMAAHRVLADGLEVA